MLQRQAFSLVELLVAMAVMAMILVLFAKIVSDSTRLSSHTKKRLGNSASAGAIISIMANDITHMVQRPDVEIKVIKNQGNDEIYFLSETPGALPTGAKPEDMCGASLVGYRISSKENSPTLSPGQLNMIQRLAHPLTWVELKSGLLPMRIGDLLSDIHPEEWQVLGGVFRLELAFSLTDGRALSDLPTQTYSYLKASDTEPIGYTQGTLQDIKCPGLLHSIQVGLAFLDEESRKLIPDSNADTLFGSFSKTFSDANDNDGQISNWKSELNNMAAGPAKIREAIDVYQTVIPVSSL